MKTPLVVLATCFAVSLTASFALRVYDRTLAQPPAKFPETTLKRFLAKAETGEVKGVRIMHYANNADLVALSGNWSPTEGRSVVALARGRLTPEEQTQLAERSYPESVLAPDETVENFIRSQHGATEASTLPALLLPTVDSLMTFFGLGFAVLCGISLMRGGTVGSFQAKLKPTKSYVNLADVAGCDEAKQEVAEIVDYLKDPQRFKDSGSTMPKGILLVGPPGTGKTMLAKAVAHEANAAFFSVDGSEFIEMFVGVGAGRVRAMFEAARKHAPSLIFIDEIDSLAQKRDGGSSGGGDREHNQTVNSLLVAMDGFEANSGVVVLAATNRPEMLDEAVMRAGRFDRKVYFELPDLEGRGKILEIHARKKSRKLADDVDLARVASETAGFSGADLATLLNEGSIHAAREHRKVTTAADIDSARDKLTWGRERNRLMSPADRERIAYHEAGHAIMQVVSKQDGYRLQKVTIIPRGRSLGSTHLSPERDILNLSTEQITARLRCLMAGRVAEEMGVGQVTSGAASDIIESTKLIRSMVFEWGMSDLGFIAFAQGSQILCSAGTIAQAEARVLAISDREYASTRQILSTHRAALDAVAKALLERETLSGEEVAQLCAGPAAPVKTEAAVAPAATVAAPRRDPKEEKVSGIPGLPQLAGC
ncbi:MAG TPA: AAA family ATPase [Opitutaceae bacterium]|nr:AAA family ATPase [Opitutaceae bacterium]